MIQDDAALRDAIEQISPQMYAQVGLVAMLSTAAVLPLAWLGVRRLVPGRNIVFARWGFSHVAMALMIPLALGLVLRFVPHDEKDLLTQLLLNEVIFGSIAVAIGVWAVRLDPDGLRVLGLRWQGAWRAILAGILAYVAVFPGLAGSMRVWAWLLELCGETAEPQEIAVRFAALPSDQLALPLLIGIVVQPLFEEVIFRSFLQPLLVQNFREVLGVGITSLLFAAMHGPEAFLPIFVLSCLLGAIKLRTQSLYAVWFLHALNNGLTFYLVLVHPELVGLGASP